MFWYSETIKTVSELHYPPTDVYENEKELVIVCEVPGMSMKDLSIETKENTLIISGTKKSSRDELDQLDKDAKRQYHLAERLEKTFRRTFFLEEKLNSNAVNATFKDGLLTIKVQKKQITPEKIEIKEEL